MNAYARDTETNPLVYAIIPARGGSKGVPGKNIRPLAGQPLIAYSIRACLLSKRISRTIISTDSDEIAEVCKKHGAEVPFKRPAEISGDTSTDTEFVLHALDWLAKNEGKVPDYLVHIRPTTPLREPKLLDEAIDAFVNNSTATALRSAHEMPESAYKTFEIDGGFFKRVGSGSFELDAANNARQGFAKTYSANGYVDVLRTKFVLDQKRIHGGKVQAYISPRVVEVDTLDEFELLEYQIKRKPELFKTLFG